MREMVGELGMCMVCVFTPCICMMRKLEERMEEIRKNTVILKTKVGTNAERSETRKEDIAGVEEGREEDPEKDGEKIPEEKKDKEEEKKTPVQEEVKCSNTEEERGGDRDIVPK